MPVNNQDLIQLLDRVDKGEVQLPDFQRPWKWDDEHIVSLLATVTMNYPMGVVMALATDRDSSTRFKARKIEGVSGDVRGKEKSLLLDGQQRITSLYRVLKSGKVVESDDPRNKDQTLYRWYYVDIAKALDPDVDREDAIVSVPADRKIVDRYRRVIVDLTTAEAEQQAEMFPLRIALDTPATLAWQFKYVGNDENRLATWTRFTSEVLQRITAYEIPVITLGSETPKEAVCRVFEKVNTGGVVLSTFELVTATYAADDFDLPEDWKRITGDLKKAFPVMAAVENKDFLQAVCLASSFHNRPTPTCKRKDMLDMRLSDYLEWSPKVEEALHWAGKFLADQCIFTQDDLPYKTQLPPLAAIRVVLGDETDSPDARRKLLQWFWCGVFGEQYGSSVDSRFVLDLTRVTDWVRGGPMPDFVETASFSASRLNSMKTRNSAAYTGVFALLVQQECYDWYFTEQPLSAAMLAEHHVDIARVFPAEWCKKNHVGDRADTVVNKTLLSLRAGQTIGKRAPSLYMQELQRESALPVELFDERVLSHLIEPDHLRADDFDAFYRYRSEELLRLIESTGCRVIRGGEGPGA
ncbi:MAG: DUF262 domain-containing protein [Acidothermales bacterium]|nr:DUF262 domain-containing protein [Acidothermales bacterium]